MLVHVFLLCVFLPLTGQNVPVPRRKAKPGCLKQRRAGCMELGCSRTAKAVSQRMLDSWVS